MRVRVEGIPSAGLVLFLEGWQSLNQADPGFLERHAESAAGAPGPVRWLLEGYLIPHSEVAGRAFAWAAVVAGIAIAIGALVRPFATGAAIVLVGATTIAGPLEREVFVLLAACCIACAISSGGRRLGLDRFLDDMLPPWLTWGPVKRRFFG